MKEWTIIALISITSVVLLIGLLGIMLETYTEHSMQRCMEQAASGYSTKKCR